MATEATLSVPVGVSGQFIHSYEQSCANTLGVGCLKFFRVTQQLRTVDRELKNCNDPVWLALFFRRHAQRNPPEQLRVRVKRLEEQRAQLLGQRAELQASLEKQAPGIPAVIETDSSTTPANLLRPPRRKPPVHRRGVAARNQIIKRFKHFGHRVICDELDDAIANGGIPQSALPSRWVRDFGVKSFVAAYSHPKCRLRVAPLISRAKAEAQLPDQSET